MSGTASAACRLAADLVTDLVSHDRRLLCLHSAAVEIGGSLIVFPSTYRAGKSTLVAALAARGVLVHADDLLPIDEAGLGVALGIAPRLRLPLPESVEKALSRLPAGHRGPSDTRYLYLSLPAGLLSPFGRRLPLGAFILLDRRAGIVPRLGPMSADEMLGRVIARNFAGGPRPAEIVDRLAESVGARPCLSLAYADPSDAAAALRAEFGGGVPHVARSEALSAIDAAPTPCRPPVSGGRRYRRRSGIVMRSFGGSAFLADRASGAIHRLNATGAVVWRLLRRPTSATEAAAQIAQAFPGERRRHIEHDVDGLFATLHRARLIALVEEPAEA